MARAGTTTEGSDVKSKTRKPKLRTTEAVPPAVPLAEEVPVEAEAAGGVAVSARQRRTRPMSDAHKEALALGRDEGRAVRAYLEAIEAVQPRRGRPRSAESIRRKLDLVERQLQGPLPPLTRLTLTQQRMDLEREITFVSDKRDIVELEEAFIKAVEGYSRRKGISWEAWRASNVSADVLRRAGITRTSA